MTINKTFVRITNAPRKKIVKDYSNPKLTKIQQYNFKENVIGLMDSRIVDFFSNYEENLQKIQQQEINNGNFNRGGTKVIAESNLTEFERVSYQPKENQTPILFVEKKVWMTNTLYAIAFFNNNEYEPLKHIKEYEVKELKMWDILKKDKIDTIPIISALEEITQEQLDWKIKELKRSNEILTGQYPIVRRF